MKGMKISLIAAMAALTAGTLCAADWYVSPKGKNKAAGNTPAAPFKNIWKAIDKAKPGDTIHIAEGKYFGKMSCGWITVNKTVNLLGGYSPDFSVRNPLVHKTMLQPTNEQNATKPTFGTMTISISGQKGNVVVDGFVFDHTLANSYHPTKGKPAGFSAGMWLPPPAKGKTKFPSIDRYMLHSEFKYGTQGDLIIQNCLFLNASNYAINANHFNGSVKILNNVFIAGRMVAAEVRKSNAKDFMVNFEFANNTVLFTWTRTSEMTDMGYGVRANEGIVANIHNNIFGLNCMAGFDNTKGNDKKKKIKLDNNIFFLNKKADVAITMSPNIKFMKVDGNGFDDLEEATGFESVDKNISLKDPKLFKDILDTNYLNAFLSATYTEKTSYDENSPINTFRAALGMNKQGTIKSKVSMYANAYPEAKVMKFFGAVPQYGAQVPAK